MTSLFRSFGLTCCCSLDGRIKVAAVHVHAKNYTFSDVALLKLEKKLDYSVGVMPICLPEVGQGSLMEITYYTFPCSLPKKRETRMKTRMFTSLATTFISTGRSLLRIGAELWAGQI